MGIPCCCCCSYICYCGKFICKLAWLYLKLMCFLTIIPVVFTTGGIVGSLIVTSNTDVAHHLEHLINETQIGSISEATTNSITKLLFGVSYSDLLFNSTLSSKNFRGKDVSTMDLFVKLSTIIADTDISDREKILVTVIPDNIKSSFILWGSVATSIYIVLALMYLGWCCCCCGGWFSFRSNSRNHRKEHDGNDGSSSKNHLKSARIREKTTDE